MTTFIIAALSADGFIARNPSHSSLTWRSQGDRQFFIAKTKEARVVVMGLNTAKTSRRPMPDRLNIIYAKGKEELPHWQEFEGWEVTQKDPATLLQEIAERGYEQVAICGGSTIYTMFMEAGVVNKLYLSVEPVVFGQGMTLFNKELDAKLELVDTKKLGEQTLLLEYTVLTGKLA
ncbi:MAG: dihydrofolate reductase family protein [Candidatus Wildermuthbacteria bacterium]|nr:dihydrofolate reductase family protein [Candidatus Wildermuthbacteria bacterium]